MAKVVRYVLIALVALFLLFAAAIVALPYALPGLLGTVAERSGYNLQVQNLDLDLFEGWLSLGDTAFSVTDSEGQVLTLGRAETRIDVGALWSDNALWVESLVIEAVSLPLTVTLDENNALTGLRLGTLDLFPQPTGDTPPANTEPSAFAFAGWQQIELRDLQAPITLVLPDATFEIPAEVDTLTVSRLDLGETEPFEVEGDMLVHGAELGFDGSVQLSQGEEPLGMRGQIDIEKLDLERFLPIAEKFAGGLPVDMSGVLNLSADVALDEQIVLRDFALAAQALNVRYDAVEPVVDLDLDDLSLKVDVLDLPALSQPLAATLTTGVGRFGQLEVNASGTFTPDNPIGTAEISAEQINLPELSGLAKLVVGKYIERGALDLQASGSVGDQGVLDAKAEIELHQLSFGADFGGGTSMAQELGMPLNTALNLLRDKDDTVRIDLPVSGDLSNPQFDIQGVINKALLNGVKTAVVSQVGPLMAISAIGKIGKLTDALKLKPIDYAAGATELPEDEEARDRVQKIRDLLERRPRIRLNICGIAGRSEGAPPEVEVELGDAARAQLLEAAQARSENAKAWFIEQGVDGKRLIICAPELDDGAMGRVEFSL